jgi:acyl-coenzyme A synthetase/AMP-(fatty) acid ligase
MLIARLGSRAGAQVPHIDPERLIRDAFEPGDLWFVTGDFATVDTEGDFWFVDRAAQMIPTRLGAVASSKIEDVLYELPAVALCIAAGRPDPEHAGSELPIAAVQLQPGASLDLEALSRVVATLPEHGRPRLVRVVDSLPMTDGFRPIKHALRGLDLAAGSDIFRWDARAQRYIATTTDRASA